MARFYVLGAVHHLHAHVVQKTRDAWASGIGKEAFLAKIKDDLELRRAFTEHMRRHGPFTIDLIPLALPDEEIVEC